MAEGVIRLRKTITESKEYRRAVILAEAGRLLDKHGVQAICEGQVELNEDLSDAIRKAKKFMRNAPYALATDVELSKDAMDVFVRKFKEILNMDSRDFPPTKEEVRDALQQMKELGKAGFVAVALLGPIPGDEFILLGIELLARRFGYSVLPRSLQMLL